MTTRTGRAGLNLDPGEREAVAAEAVAFARRLPDPHLQARYEALAAQAEAGQLADDLVGLLETMLEMLGRSQSLSPALLRVFARTPQGRRLHAAARDVSQALGALRGQVVQALTISAAPGYHTLAIETDRSRLTLEFTPHGARIASIDTSG